MPIKSIIFDMDGVICDTNPYHSQAFQAFFDKRGLYPSEEEFAEHMYGKSNSYIFSHFLGRKVEGAELALFEEEKEGLFRKIYVDVMSPIEGYLDFLSWLQSDQYNLGVATSAPRANRDLILNGLRIQNVFSSLMASEDVTEHKPAPEVYLTSAQNLGSDPKECLVFEDSFSGISAAINAGMKVVGVLSSHTKEELPPCDYYIDNYMDGGLKAITKGWS